MIHAVKTTEAPKPRNYSRGSLTRAEVIRRIAVLCNYRDVNAAAGSLGINVATLYETCNRKVKLSPKQIIGLAVMGMNPSEIYDYGIGKKVHGAGSTKPVAKTKTKRAGMMARIRFLFTGKM